MWDWWKYKREIASLDRWERKERAAFDKRVAVAKREKTKPPDEGEIVSLVWMIDELRNGVITKQLIKEANALYVPTPKINDPAWEEGSSSPRRYLTVAAAAALRASIREERNQRWQFWELRVKVIGLLLTGLTGAVGTLIGLVAVLYK